MLEVRRSEEAEERRMIGSGRERFLREETRGPLLLSAVEGTVEVDMVEGTLGQGRLRPRNISAIFRMNEKSCTRGFISGFRKREKGYWLDPAKEAIPIAHSPFSVIVRFPATGDQLFFPSSRCSKVRSSSRSQLCRLCSSIF